VSGKLQVGDKIKTRDLSYAHFTVVAGSTIQLSMYSNGDCEPRKIITATLENDIDIFGDSRMQVMITDIKNAE
jgi:hypothetical protein